MRSRPVVPIVGRRVMAALAARRLRASGRHPDPDQHPPPPPPRGPLSASRSSSAPSAGSAASPAPTSGSPSAAASAAASAPPWRWPSSASCSRRRPAASTSRPRSPEPERALHRNVTMIPAAAPGSSSAAAQAHRKAPRTRLGYPTAEACSGCRAEARSGEGGIRTLERACAPYSLSRRVPSATRPPLRALDRL